MNKTEVSGPAFPGLHPSRDCRFQEEGMTLRDYFAAKALAALVGHTGKDGPNRGVKAVPALAKYAYEYADAMLEARK